MSDHMDLPNRRYTETVDFATAQRMTSPPIDYRASIGFADDGRLAEVFLQAGKAGTDLRIQAHEAAILASKALQYGCPPEELRTAMPRAAAPEGTLGQPEGAIGTLLDLLKAEGRI